MSIIEYGCRFCLIFCINFMRILMFIKFLQSESLIIGVGSIINSYGQSIIDYSIINAAMIM